MSFWEQMSAAFAEPRAATTAPGGSENAAGVTPPATPNTVLRVESRDPCFPFKIHLMVRYKLRPDTAMDNPPLIAQAGIERRVRRTAAEYRLTQWAALRRELEISLSERLDVERTGVIAWASCLAVEAPEQYLEAVQRHEQLRREEAARSWTHTAEEAEVAHLSRLLTDPQRATAWWFRKNPDAVQQLPEVARIFSSLHRDLVPETTGDSWDALFSDVGREAEGSAQRLLAYQIQQVLVEHKLDHLADRARLLDGDTRPE